jgi:transposase
VRSAQRGAPARGRKLKVCLTDEARLGRINRPRRGWARWGTRPQVAAQLIREYTYLYGAVCPQEGSWAYVILPDSNTYCCQLLLHERASNFARGDLLLVLDGAPYQDCQDIVQPQHVSFLFLPPYAPERNPKENIWEEMREKIGKNYALKSMEAVQKKMVEAGLYIERKPKIVKSITSFPYIINSL